MYFVLHGSRVIGPEAPSEILEGCRRLARLSGEGLLGIELSEDFRFAGASPLPDLRLGGKPLLDALVCALRGAP